MADRSEEPQVMAERRRDGGGYGHGGFTGRRGSARLAEREFDRVDELRHRPRAGEPKGGDEQSRRGRGTGGSTSVPAAATARRCADFSARILGEAIEIEAQVVSRSVEVGAIERLGVEKQAISLKRRISPESRPQPPRAAARSLGRADASGGGCDL